MHRTIKLSQLTRFPNAKFLPISVRSLWNQNLLSIIHPICKDTNKMLTSKFFNMFNSGMCSSFLLQQPPQFRIILNPFQFFLHNIKHILLYQFVIQITSLHRIITVSTGGFTISGIFLYAIVSAAAAALSLQFRRGKSSARCARRSCRIPRPRTCPA